MPLRRASAVAVLVLSAPTFGITALSPTDPSLQGTTIAAETFTIDTQDSGEPVPPPVPVLFVDEKIVQNTSGTLDFYFKLRNVSDPQTLNIFSLSYPASIQASAFYLDEGNLGPTNDDFSNMGSLVSVGWGFGDAPIIGPQIGSGGTDTLLLRTNANAYTSGPIGALRQIDDFEIQPGTGLVPGASSVPEPSALALLCVGILGLGIKFGRRTYRTSSQQTSTNYVTSLNS